MQGSGVARQNGMTRVLLIVIDGCSARVLGRAVQDGELPLLSALAERGSLRSDCVSVFPSITPAATASIITGRYPSQHGIGGMSWWDPGSGDVLYLGDDVATILKRGMGDFLRSFLFRLNGEQLIAPTLFEVVERHHRRAACINYLVFRGDVAHRVSPPLLLRLLPTFWESMKVHGPSWLGLGTFVSTAGSPFNVGISGGLAHRFGLDDEGTARFLDGVPNAGALPDFTVAYFADYDFDSHERGPLAAFDTMRQVDRRLGAIIDHWGGLDRVLHETCIVITADHAQSGVGPAPDCAIELEEILSGYRRATPGSGWGPDDDVLLCPNMRSAEIYVREGRPETVHGTCRALLEARGVDHVIWRGADHDGDVHVATRDRGSLRFRRARGGVPVRDEYGGCWELDGERGALDLSVDRGLVRYGVYPNALERLANGVGHPRAGRVWITARPGFEFRQPGGTVHSNGGSHGTLHELDSLVPLLVAGQPPEPALRVTPRIVDVAPLCAAWLGIPFDVRPGAAHAG